MTSTPEVLISEVGPRDGLQSVKATMPTVDKLRWIDALVAAGLREIEVGSFVPARLLPQLADTAEVVHHAIQKPGWTVMALAPNLRGAQAAIEAGVHKLTLPVSASEAHSLANVRKTRAQMAAHEILIAEAVGGLDRTQNRLVLAIGLAHRGRVIAEIAGQTHRYPPLLKRTDITASMKFIPKHCCHPNIKINVLSHERPIPWNWILSTGRSSLSCKKTPRFRSRLSESGWGFPRTRAGDGSSGSRKRG